MEESLISRSLLFTSCFLAITVLFYSIAISMTDSQTTIIFCTNAAILIRHYRNTILVNTGSNDRINQCLGDHLPFYNKTLDYVIISSAKQSSLGGFHHLIEHYQIKTLILPSINSNSDGYELILSDIKIKHIKTLVVNREETIQLKNTRLNFYWPTNQYLKTLGKSSKETNNSSLVFSFQEGSNILIFPSNISDEILQKIIFEHRLQPLLLVFSQIGVNRKITSDSIKLAKNGTIVIKPQNIDANLSQLKALNVTAYLIEGKKELILKLKKGKIVKIN